MTEKVIEKQYMSHFCIYVCMFKTVRYTREFVLTLTVLTTTITVHAFDTISSAAFYAFSRSERVCKKPDQAFKRLSKFECKRLSKIEYGKG